jgi:tRNA(Ile)-lysidine synthase
MANSKKLLLSKGLEHHLKTFLVDVFLSQKRINPKLVVAFSGGLDSCVLLHLLANLRKTLPFQLSAHHVNHGLSPNADTWANFCAEFCKKLKVPLTISKVKVEQNSGLGLEAAAREARYSALAGTDADFLCLAHHQDDQAETLLLQLARGAGVKGLAGMAAVDTSRKLLRPLLDAPRSALEAYANANKLTWINDESNADTKFDRNFMRHEILPKLEAQYPAIKQTISRSASHLADGSALLDDLAKLDATNSLQNSRQLALPTLKHLSLSRVNNVLRWWLAQQGFDLPSTAQLQQISQQISHAKADAAIQLKVAQNVTLRRYQDCAYLVDDCPASTPINLLWQGEESVILPDNTHLIFTQKMGEGFALNRVKNIKLRIKNREGGERFKPELGRPYRSLKQVLQTHAMPPWQREQLPLIFMDETLVIIPNVGVDAGFQAGKDEMGLMVEWVNNPSPVGGISNDLADVVCQPSQMLSCSIRGVEEGGNGGI